MQAKKTQDISIRYIKGVGPKRAEHFSKLGIENVSDVFYYLPRRYEDRTNISKVKNVKPGEEHSIRGKITGTDIFRARTGTNIFQIEVADDTGRITAVWYNMPFMQNTLKKGKEVILYGKVELHRKLQFTHPAYDIIDENNSEESLEVGRIVPVYPVTQEISQKYMRRIVYSAISTYLDNKEDTLPTYIRAKNKMVDFKFAVKNIHFPHSAENLSRAYKRLVFEEFFTLQVVLALKRKKQKTRGIEHKKKEGLLDEFQSLFTFTFTPEQLKCIKEIERDMAKPEPMYRLLQGDVGSGKTIVALFASVMAARNGYQSVIMAPTEVLARQHFVTAAGVLMPMGFNVKLLVNGLKEKDKTIIRQELASGEADILVGTHSVFQKGVEYNRLGLIIIDEQHKFGVDQRSLLRGKNVKADTLVMTATPIPRSLAMTVYGDMDISLLKSKPTERKPVITCWVGRDKREEVYNFLKEEIKKGRQAFIICPRIGEGKDAGLVSAEKMYASLKDGYFKGTKLGLIHGKMKMSDKDKVMDKFKSGKIGVLVSTTVVEVGVDVPNATVMMVENADRYGLAQLHQLRGRIGRGKHSSYCILVGDAKTASSEDRLNAISETSDGFRIAEKDLDIRGPGEFLGRRQSGLPELRFGSITDDFDLMEMARHTAFELIEKDPGLAEDRHKCVRASIRERFRRKREENRG